MQLLVERGELGVERGVAGELLSELLAQGSPSVGVCRGLLEVRQRLLAGNGEASLEPGVQAGQALDRRGAGCLAASPAASERYGARSATAAAASSGTARMEGLLSYRLCFHYRSSLKAES